MSRPSKGYRRWPQAGAALISAMAACTWHLFDNSSQLHGLVVLQAGLTFVGNATLAGAAGLLLRQQRARRDSNDVVANP